MCGGGVAGRSKGIDAHGDRAGDESRKAEATRHQLANSGEDIIVETVDHGAHGDDRGDADNDAENGERGAKRVFAQRVECERDLVFQFKSFRGLHEAAKFLRSSGA